MTVFCVVILYLLLAQQSIKKRRRKKAKKFQTFSANINYEYFIYLFRSAELIHLFNVTNIGNRKLIVLCIYIGTYVPNKNIFFGHLT